MTSILRPAIAPLAALAALAVIAGCGGDANSTTPQPTATAGAPEAPSQEQPLSAAEQHGRELFVQNCGSCHTLDAAGTTGQIGPDLGDIPLTEEDVLAAIRTGGGEESHGAGGRTGNMPRNLVTGKDANDVAAFVSASGPGAGTP
jgi:mono/diheme cytochrome c family protein